MIIKLITFRFKRCFVDLKSTPYSLNSIKKIIKEIDKIALQKNLFY